MDYSCFEHGHSALIEYLDFGSRQPRYATAREIYQNSVPIDVGRFLDEHDCVLPPKPDQKGMSPADVMGWAYRTASRRGIKDDILRRGVINPIRIDPKGTLASDEVYKEAGREDRPLVPMICNGQHRLSVMLKHNPDIPIPLEWASLATFRNASRSLNRRYNLKTPFSNSPVMLPQTRKP